MNRITVVLGISLLLFAVALQAQTPAQAPKPGPEHQKLGVMVGTWDYESENKLTGAKSKGSQTCEWSSGGFFVVCRTKSASGEGISIMGYNPEEKVYTDYRYFTSGASDFAKGWMQGNTWTFVWEGERSGGKLRRRQAIIQMSPTSYTVKMERSVEGEPWVVTSEYKVVKVK